MKKLTLALVAASVAATMTTGVMAQGDSAPASASARTPLTALQSLNLAPGVRGTAANANDLDEKSGSGSGTLTVNGKVIDQTCEIKTGYKHLVVVLDTVGIGALKAPGQTTGWQEFGIKLTNCSVDYVPSAGGTKVFATFQPNSADVDTANANTLKNRLETTGHFKANPTDPQRFFSAKNVNIQLTDKNRQGIRLLDNTPTTSTVNGVDVTTFKLDTSTYDGSKVEMKSGPDAPTEYEIKYGARYYATAQAEPGEVQAFTTYTIAYE